MATTTDAQRVERALQLLDARLAKSDLFNDGTVKIVPSTSNVGEWAAESQRRRATCRCRGQQTLVAGVLGAAHPVCGAVRRPKMAALASQRP